MTRSLCRRTMGVSLRGGADISRFKVTSENSYQGIEFPWRSPLPRAIIRAADNENLFSPLPRGACETSQPFLHPPPFLFVRISPPRTPPPLPLPSSIFTRLIDSSDACIIEHSFSLFRSASVQPKFSLAITANRILFAIIAGDEPRLPYRVPPPPSFLGRVPRRNSTVSPTFSTRWIFSSARKGNRRGPLHPRVYIHLENSSVNSGACSLEIGYERERFYRGREGDLSFRMRIRRVLGGDFFLWIDFFFWSSISRKMRLSVY